MQFHAWSTGAGDSWASSFSVRQACKLQLCSYCLPCASSLITDNFVNENVWIVLNSPSRGSKLKWIKSGHVYGGKSHTALMMKITNGNPLLPWGCLIFRLIFRSYTWWVSKCKIEWGPQTSFRIVSRNFQNSLKMASK